MILEENFKQIWDICGTFLGDLSTDFLRYSRLKQMLYTVMLSSIMLIFHLLSQQDPQFLLESGNTQLPCLAKSYFCVFLSTRFGIF